MGLVRTLQDNDGDLDFRTALVDLRKIAVGRLQPATFIKASLFGLTAPLGSLG